MNIDIIIKDIDENKINYVVGIISKIKCDGNVVFSIKKEEKNRIVEFLKSKRIALRLENGKKVIESIVLDKKIKIKDASNRISHSVANKFNIAKSYVATTKKSIVDKCKSFYARIKNKIEKPKLIFDISKEINLQRSLEENKQTEQPQVVEPSTTVVQNIPDTNAPKQEELPKIVINPKMRKIKKSQRVLNLKPDFCQKINEGMSLVLRAQTENIEQIKGALGLPTVKVNRPKRLVRVNGGFISTIAIAAICLIAMGIVSYLVTSKLIG